MKLAGKLYSRYMAAVREHGYESRQAEVAYERWAKVSGLSDRQQHTARPVGDTRPLAEIYPTERPSLL